MEIKIEASSDELRKIHQLLYNENENIDIDEEYGDTVGVQKEPLVVALIIALTPVSIAIVRGYFKTKQAEIKAENERLKIEKKSELDTFKLYIKEGNKWQRKSIDHFEKSTTIERPPKK